MRGLLAAAKLCASMALMCDMAVAANYVPPKLADGKTPDLRGIWQARGTAYLNIEGHRGGKGIAASPSIIVDPLTGKIPYRPEAQAVRDANFAQRQSIDPANHCFQSGVPRATYLPTPMQIVQSPGHLALVYQDSHSYRIVYPDSRPHFEGVDWWMGDSRSRWEGNTLVIDVTTQNDRTWLDAAGNHHSNNIHVVERYTRVGRDQMIYEARIEDTAIYTQPWTLRTTLYRDTRNNARLIEDECLEDETGIRRRIAPTDPRNLLINDYRRWKSTGDSK